MARTRKIGTSCSLAEAVYEGVNKLISWMRTEN